MNHSRSLFPIALALTAFVVTGCGRGFSVSLPPTASSHLSILEQPSQGRADRALEPLRVALLDKDGELMTSASTAVRVELATGPAGATLSGTTMIQAVDGVAEFRDLSVSPPGVYTLRTSAVAFQPTPAAPVRVQADRLHVIVMIADGWGFKQIEATEQYLGQSAIYRHGEALAMSTFDEITRQLHGGVGYDPVAAWSNFGYLTAAATDSAAAATAMYTGEKTVAGRIGVDVTGNLRLPTLSELAVSKRLGIGVVSSVPIPHATPAAWLAHNQSRHNYYAIADEMLWGDPNTTGTPAWDSRYGGSLGPNPLRADVILGGGHPHWAGEATLRNTMRDKLNAENGLPGAWTFVERIAGSPGAARLQAAARDASTTRLVGLFGDTDGSLGYRRADGSGVNPENPNLAEMTDAALTVLGRKPEGFALVIEGGAVDWAGHQNDMNRLIGELRDFNAAVETVVAWVQDSSNGSDWSNTVLVVTGDHETGLLTAGPNVFPDAPLGEVSPRTLALEKPQRSTGHRASWEDLDGDDVIDPNETVYWAWHTHGHSNSLIPLFVRGSGAAEFRARAVDFDARRGLYLDNTDLSHALAEIVLAQR